jgi:hypothetical protein
LALCIHGGHSAGSGRKSVLCVRDGCGGDRDRPLGPYGRGKMQRSTVGSQWFGLQNSKMFWRRDFLVDRCVSVVFISQEIIFHKIFIKTY